jgi:ectoine hydroxylase-related dioxygenase (phytanoyl-CoA dioxygenase family)
MQAHFEIERDGFEIRKDILSNSELSILDQASKSITVKGSYRGGDRNVFDKSAEVLRIFKNGPLRKIVEEILGKNISLSEALYLNKGSDANWLVAWHQDLSICVKRMVEAPGYVTWVKKEGKPYVQPPDNVLQESLWLRLNLDDNDESNGCLKVIPGSHKYGKLGPVEIEEWVKKETAVSLHVSRGSAILFRPLLLHSSGKMVESNMRERRVIQGLFSGYQFKNGLEWAH